MLAQCCPKRGRKPKNRAFIDMHYDALRHEMRELFDELGVVT